MEISRLDAGAESVRVESVDIGALVAGAVRSRGWERQVRLDVTSVRVTTDPRRLEWIVANLVDNALVHGGRGVAVRAARNGAGAVIEVADRGPGIEPGHLAHLFDRFYKADPSRSSRGTGLGLAIAQENARLIGTEIQVSSEPGRGTRFTLQLALVAEPLQTDDGAVSSVSDDGAR
jgi:two-component system sensor histidine kinase MtrB